METSLTKQQRRDISKVKANLEEMLDLQFPKGECKERGNALMLFATAMSNVTMLSAEAHAQGVEEENKRVLKKVIKADKDIRFADKTPKYEYSKNQCDANNAGKFTEEVGSRWAMPWEISASLVKAITNNTI